MLSTKLKEAAGNSADATLYVDDVFSTYLYTGNGSTQTITNGIDLAGKGGLVWIKSRNVSETHTLFDTARGVNKVLQTQNADGSANFNNSLTAFNADGFTLGSNRTDPSVNYASWTFREAAKFFDVVTYTGNGVSGRFINHSLTIRPGLMFIKRTDTTSNWVVMSNDLSYSMWLNSTNADVSSNNVNGYIPDFTASSFQVNAGSTSINDVNASGGTYVAYLFAHDTSSTGIIQCGSATCDSGGIATFNVGWQPQYILFKSSSSVSDWRILDTMRGWVNNTTGNQQGLLANSSAAETAYGWTDTLSATGGTIWGSAGQTFIYMAIRMPNKPPTTGTQVFSPNYFASGTSSPIVTNFPVDMQLYAYPPGASSINTAVVDRLRGVSTTTTTGGPRLITSGTAAESAAASSLGWSNIGFSKSPSFGSSDAQLYLNFKRAPGFFDEVCYTGTAAYPTTINHNLGAVPEIVLIKNRSSVASWVMQSSSLPSLLSSYIALNSNSAALSYGFAWQTPTSTTFGFDGFFDSPITNASGDKYVAYLFATLAGISKVGSYTGNGTGQAIACGFGAAGARFVLIKRTDSTGDWYTFDSARGLTVGSSPYLLLNSTAAEVTGNNGVFQSTGGFTLGATAITTTNIATATYIFLAVA